MKARVMTGVTEIQLAVSVDELRVLMHHMVLSSRLLDDRGKSLSAQHREKIYRHLVFLFNEAGYADAAAEEQPMEECP